MAQVINGRFIFHCPGCRTQHVVRVVTNRTRPGDQGHNQHWQWNGCIDKPSLYPGIKTISDVTCHLYIREGRISYCPDSTHELAGKVVELE